MNMIRVPGGGWVTVGVVTANIRVPGGDWFKDTAAGGGVGQIALFRQPLLNGLGSGGPFFHNPLG